MLNNYALGWKTHAFVGKNIGIEHGEDFKRLFPREDPLCVMFEKQLADVIAL